MDLGLDAYLRIASAFSRELVPKGSVQLPRGKGPRHLLFHPKIRAADLVNELDSTVSCFKVNVPEEWTAADHWGVAEKREEDCRDEGAVLELTQCLSSLPESEQGKTTISPQGIWKAASHSSEIPCIRRAATSSWATGVTPIAVYEVCQVTGQITLEITPSGGSACATSTGQRVGIPRGWKPKLELDVHAEFRQRG